LSLESLGPLADDPDAQNRLKRVNDLFSFLTLMDSLAQRFFETHRGLRDAVELLAENKTDHSRSTSAR
jgi:hypothetical protein